MDRLLRRELTADERAMVQARHDELLPVMAPLEGRVENAPAALAIAEMFGSFRSMRQTGDEAVSIIDSARRAVERFPLWAIMKVCHSIQENGVLRNDRYDRQWPPNDSELIAALREEIRHYERNFHNAAALLTAKVESA